MDDYEEYFKIANIFTQIHAMKSKNEQKQVLSDFNPSFNKNLQNLNHRSNDDYCNFKKTKFNDPSLIENNKSDQSSKFLNDNSNSVEFGNKSDVSNFNYNINISSNIINLRNSQKENKKNIYTNESILIEDEYNKNSEDHSLSTAKAKHYENYNINFNPNINNFAFNCSSNNNHSLILNSKNFQDKNKNEIYFPVDDSNNIYKNNYRNSLPITTNPKNFRLIINDNSNGAPIRKYLNNKILFTSNNNNTQIKGDSFFLESKKKYLQEYFNGSFSSTNCSIDNLINIENQNNFDICFKSIEIAKKPSLDNLPFMRNNSGNLNFDSNNLHNSFLNICHKPIIRSKKDEMNKWLSRI